MQERNQVVQKLEKEISSIKQEIKEKPIFEETVSAVQNESEAKSIKLLGELLVTLRKARSMSLLMLCRQISKIELDGKTAVIFSEDKDIIELQKNERYFA